MQSEAEERAEPREGRVSPSFSAADMPTLACQVVALNLPPRALKEGSEASKPQKTVSFLFVRKRIPKKRLIQFQNNWGERQQDLAVTLVTTAKPELPGCHVQAHAVRCP